MLADRFLVKYFEHFLTKIQQIAVTVSFKRIGDKNFFLSNLLMITYKCTASHKIYSESTAVAHFTIVCLLTWAPFDQIKNNFILRIY